MNIRARLLLLYPVRWRVRYGDEFLAVLEAYPLRPRDLFDIAFNALDAHINPNLAIADTTLTERMRRIMQKLRSLEITVFAAWIAFVVAGLHFYSLMDDSPYLSLTGLGGGPGLVVDFGKPMNIAWDVLGGGSAIALLAVLVGGLPLAYAAWRRAPQARRFFIVPVVAFVAVVIVPIISVSLLIITKHGPVQPLVNPGITLGYGALFIAAAAASVWAVARAISQTVLPEGLVRFAVVPSLVTVLAMALMLGATLAWGVYAHMQLPATFDSANFFTGYPTLLSWGVDVVVMSIATGIAAASAIRGIGARGGADASSVVTA